MVIVVRILVFLGFTLLFVADLSARQSEIDSRPEPASRPNILFAIADDWGWPHAGVYGDPVVKTPNFDRIAREGVLFENAFVSSPSCTPSRNAILTGKFHWRLGSGANLWSKLNPKHQTFPHLLEANGYFVGHHRKSWGPGKLDNWDRHPAGKRFDSVDDFFKTRPQDKPFCFWFGAVDPHRPYKPGTGQESGMDLSKIRLFKHFPDCQTIRSDVADYYFEVERFDREVGEVLKKLEAMGELDNTIVVMTGDHGMPFPRCKANLYDSGTHVPMAVRWPSVVQSGRMVSDFVSTVDLAPTFLDAAGVAVSQDMNGKSWLNILNSKRSGRIEPARDHVVMGKERHVPAQAAPDSGGTPMRGIRTDDFLLIRNFTPDRWPAGTPDWENAFIRGCWLADCDNGPTKTYIVDNQNKDADHKQAYQLSFGKRPEFELYDLGKDPDQLINVAGLDDYANAKAKLNQQLTQILQETEDPRIRGNGAEVFDSTEYFGRGPRHPDFKK